MDKQREATIKDLRESLEKKHAITRSMVEDQPPDKNFRFFHYIIPHYEDKKLGTIGSKDSTRG